MSTVGLEGYTHSRQAFPVEGEGVDSRLHGDDGGNGNDGGAGMAQAGGDEGYAKVSVKEEGVVLEMIGGSQWLPCLRSAEPSAIIGTLTRLHHQ